jgi:hypothetical protein
MEQKFVKFEEALEKLDVSAEVLNELRERGELRAYRDGTSWKFRADEIERLAAQGIPEPPPPSDIGLVSAEELVPAEPLATDDEEMELELADDQDTELSQSSTSLKSRDESELEPELVDTDPLSTGSELELAELEDTVTAGTSDLMLEGVDEPSEPSDSILLSEEELGESVGPHASTIIGKSELEDADLQLAGEAEDDVHGSDSDVSLAPSGASDVHSSQVAGSGVLDTGGKESSNSGRSAFEGLEELEIDLAAESSRILLPEDVEAAQAAGKSAAAKKGDSDLKLGEGDELVDDNNQGSTDVPLLELEGGEAPSEEDSGSEIDLATDEDLVLSDSSDSDITLDSGDSGINLVAPSDSGLALDDIPLDVGGSAILSSLSLSGDSDPEISLLADQSRAGEDSGAALQTDDDFQLTPMSDKMAEIEGDSSSQVIALDADLGELRAEAPVFEEAGLTAEAEEGVVLSEDFGAAPAGELGAAYAAAPAAAVAGEFPYSLPNIFALSSVTLLLIVAGVMMLDIVRNIWSWQESYSVNSSLLDALLGMFGLK